jgi:hypothetical protein
MIQWRDLLNTAMNLEMPAELRRCFKALENIDGWKFPLGLYSTEIHKTIPFPWISFEFMKFVNVMQF